LERRVYRAAAVAGVGSNARLLWRANVRRGAAPARAGIGRRPSSDEGACPGFRFRLRLRCLFLRAFVSLPSLTRPALDAPDWIASAMQHGSRSRLIRVVGLINPTAALVSVCSAASCKLQGLQGLEPDDCMQDALCALGCLCAA
jgi:hypothetical protein